MLLTELLETQDAVGRLLASFFAFDEQLQLLELNRSMVRCSFRREVFASNCWSIPKTRWLAYQVLRDFTMINEVTSVLVWEGDWQQPLLSRFPALRKVQIMASSMVDLLPEHFPTRQIIALDLGMSNICNLAPLSAFPNLEKLVLPNGIELLSTHVLELLQSLTTLTVGTPETPSEVDSLSFLEKLANLTELSLNSVQATSRQILIAQNRGNVQGQLQTVLAPLTHLNKMRKLDIARLVPDDLRLLQASAATLTSLTVRESKSSSSRTESDKISLIIPSLVNLQELQLEESPILAGLGLAPLASLVNLKVLKLGGNTFDDLYPLITLTELKTLRIHAKPGTDWSPIAYLKKLESLDQMGTCFSLDPEEAMPLGSPPILRELSSPVALSPRHPLLRVRSLTLTFMAYLVNLDVYPIPVDEICPNIRILRLHGHFNLVRLGVSKLKKLEELEFGGHNITEGGIQGGGATHPIGCRIDYGPLSALHQLRKLVLINTCQAADYRFLQSLVNLRELKFYNQSISDISVLANMPHLEILCLYSSPIEDISVLGSLPQLRELSLSCTNVKDVSCLRGLPRLMNLFLPQAANCAQLLNDYGVSLPRIRKYEHEMHDCKHLDDSDVAIPEFSIQVINGTPGWVDP